MSLASAKVTRKIEDRLREEYFDLLPNIRRVLNELEAEVKHCLIPISLRLEKHERLIVTSRVKECDSAVDSLRRRQEGATFDTDRPERYALTSLNDLAGVRVLAFPRARLGEADQQLRTRFPSWRPDPVAGHDGEPLASKYYGYCKASGKIRAELQIVPMLTVLFWEVEHSVIYKPTPRLRGVARSLDMQQRTMDVLNALRAFEEEFANLVQRDHRVRHRRRVRQRRRTASVKPD